MFTDNILIFVRDEYRAAEGVDSNARLIIKLRDSASLANRRPVRRNTVFESRAWAYTIPITPIFPAGEHIGLK